MIINTIYTYIKKNSLITPGDTVIIGLSGGPDSIFLLHVLRKIQNDLQIKLVAAYLDHEWRPESAQEALWCALQCKDLGIPFETARASQLEIAYKKNGSKEAYARALRRHFLETVRKKYNAQSIALGHHEQDQQETFFMRIIRGATLSGLTGMRPKAGYYIRPLLETSKKDIVEYLNNHKIAYLTDPTNISSDYLRNRIRMKALPALQECDARFDNNFLRTLHSLQETEDFLSKLTFETLQSVSTQENNNLVLELNKFFELHPVLQNRVLLQWLIHHKVPFMPSTALLEEIKRFLKQPGTGVHSFYDKWSLNKKDSTVSVSKSF